MARKRQPYQQKLRTREHVIAELAVNHVELQGLACGYSFERISHDYGLDMILFTYADSGELQDGEIFLQVKGKERIKPARGGQTVPFRIERADFHTWRRRRMPVILIVFDASARLAYWVYVQRYFATLPDFDPLAVGETITVHVPVGQVLTPDAMRQFATFRDELFARIGGSIRDHA